MSSEKWFIQKLLEIDQRVTALSRGGVGIGKSSIASGESLTVATETGEVVFKDGGLDYVSGEVPPVPSSPTLVQDFGQLRVTWDGTFAGEVVEGVEEPVLVDAPLDLDVIEVHASRDPEEANWGADTMRSQIKTREGGTVPITGFDVDDEVFVVLIALSKTGLRSEPSAPTSIVIEGLNFDQLFNELDAATTIINNAREILIENEKTLGEKLDEVPDAEGIADDIAQARQEAIDAALAELDALEGTLTTKIDGKTTTKWSTSDPPESYSGAVGDTWIKLTSLGTGGREIARSKWNGTTWTVHKVDGASLSNVDASTITAGFLDVANRIRSGSIFADKLLIGGPRNLLPNGDLDKGSAVGWPVAGGGDAGPVYDTLDKAEGKLARVSYHTATTQFGSSFGRFSVSGMETLVMEAWVKADKPGSIIYVELKDQDNAHAGTSSRSAWGTAGGWVGDTASYSYPFGRVEVPTTWTKIRSTLKLAPGTSEVYVNGMYFNHSSGTERDATVSYSGLSLRPMVGGTLIEPGGVQTPHLAADVLEVGNLKAGTAAIAEAVVKKLFAEVVVAEMVTATEFIGENAILTGAVTAPKLTVTEEMWAKFGEFVKIRAGQIEADAIDGMTVTGTTLQSRDGNFRAGDDGVYIAQPDGTSLVRFPTDGSPLSMTAADVEIDRSTVGKLDVDQQIVRSDGSVTLAAGVTAPASPPDLSSSWRGGAKLPRPAEKSMDWTGLAVWNGRYVRGVNVLGSDGDPFDRIEVYNLDGTLNKSINIDLNPRAGVTVIGDIVYTIGPDHVKRSGAERQWCHGFNLNTGSRVSRWEYVHFYASDQKKIAIGADGSNLIVAGVAPNVVLSVFKYNPSTGAQVGSQMTTSFDVGYAAELHGVAISGGKVYVSPRGQVREYTVSGSTLTKTAGFAWDNPNWNSGGFVFVNDRPVVVDSGSIYFGSGYASDTTVQACYTWFDGSRETEPSPIATISFGEHETVTASLAKRSGYQKRVYYREGTSGSWRRLVVGANVTAIRWDGTPSAPTAELPTESTFPTSTPAALKSGLGNLELRGDGSGQWGPLTFGADGSMTGINKTAAGRVIMSPTSEDERINVYVTFPAGRFSDRPAVTVTADSVVPERINGLGAASPTATGFRLYFSRTTVADTGVTWIAMEMD